VERAAITADFLDEYQREELETEGTALTLLMDVPLADLAKSFHMEGPYGVIDTKPGSPALQRLFEIIRKEGDEKAALACTTYLQNPANAEEVGDTLAYVFYEIALQSQAKVPQQDITLVEEAVAHMPAGKGFADIPGFFGDKQPGVVEAYERLVTSGRNQATQDGRTLGQFMRTEVGLDDAR
jgi:hypothetical protein